MVCDTLHRISSEVTAKVLTAIPKPFPVADTALGKDIQKLTLAINAAAETSTWDYIRDWSSLIIALASVVVAFLIFNIQRSHQKKDARLSWIRQFIVEPRIELITKFFSDLSVDLQSANISPLSINDRIRIVNTINTKFNELARNFLEYTDSIDNSPIPKLLHTIADEHRDELADLIDSFDDNNQTGSYQAIVSEAVAGRNRFFSALYRLSSE